jgi:hypothetical protein
MLNCKLIQDALKLYTDYCEINGRPVTDTVAYDCIHSWYVNSDIADAEYLAAAALHWGRYDCSADYDAIVEAAMHYFPTEPVEYQGYISVEELREALDEDLSFYS